ncbi:MAG: hypothetical protein IPF66_14560 [Holophagales bacterium]|nr:hypothetical protein [Holophagales bacterium]
MPLRHAFQMRSLFALVLVTGLLPLVATSRVEAICAAPAAAMPAGCCPQSAPPACPACPREGRSPAPAAPSRTATCCALAALPPGEASPESRDSRSPESTTSALETVEAGPARAVSAVRLTAVREASPPPRLLACTFRN